MKILISRDCLVRGAHVPKGTVLDVETDLDRTLFSAGAASLHLDPAPEVPEPPAPVETAPAATSAKAAKKAKV